MPAGGGGEEPRRQVDGARLRNVQWQAICFLERGTVVDSTWLHASAEFLAAIEDAGDCGDLDGSGVD
ncbi:MULTISPECIES: hypothetical protein [unclassified Streptomyces]|uniref:hypothetical protein n=1 Tax=unclassified Streptomyces TaxID=2593676 RepID=UPI00224F4036|nr:MULTISPECIES: hypothetical protein [unclassified Streptomyces]MCX5063787.1 hypothetical protein [Streptomyces sp. NBC_00452]MCX5294155.1 hypothetical protein [Streptomyces sp. NBC_00183]